MKDRKISELFEKSMQWIEETGGSIEEAASQFPLYQEDLLDMLKTKGKLDQTTHPNPRPEFKAVARTRLLNQIQAENKTSQNQSVTKHQPLRQILQNYNLIRRLSMTWIIILGILVATFTGGGSVALASIDALPGDSLYPVKTTMQDFALLFNSDKNDLDLLLGNLGENIEELNQLAAQNRYSEMSIGLEEYEKNLQALIQTRTRLAYEDAGSDESLNNRIQSQLNLHLEAFDQLKLQTQDQLRVQDQLKDAIQLTETGKVYGPNEGSPNEEPGSPNEAGPGESQQDGKPDDNGTGQGQTGNPYSGNQPQGEQNGPGNGDGQAQCTCQEEGLSCANGEVLDENGQVLAEAVCTCQDGETEQYCYQYQYQGDNNQNGSGSGENSSSKTGKP